MAPRDHNKALVVLHSLVGGFLGLLLCASPWIIAKNVSSTPSPRRDDQIMTAAIVTGVVIFLFLLLLSTAIGLYKRKPWGRKLALCAAGLWLFYCPPVAVYSWWFLHSEGGKRLYGMASPPD